MPSAPEVALYDSITLSNIPQSATAVAGYVDGRWQTWSSVLQRWPKARHVSITTTGRQDADVVDVEAGDVSPSGALQWLRRMKALGHPAPGVYASLDVWCGLLGPLLLSQFKRSEFRVWTAHYTHRWHRCSQNCDSRLRLDPDATQFTNQALGRDLDCSAALTPFFTRHTPGTGPAGR